MYGKASRFVDDAHCGIPLVHVLASGTTRTCKGNIQLTFWDMRLVSVRKLRQDLDEREAGLPLVRAERRYAYQAVHARFVLQGAIRTCAAYLERNAPESVHGVFVRREKSRLPSLPRRVFAVHLEKYARKILGVVAA